MTHRNYPVKDSKNLRVNERVGLVERQQTLKQSVKERLCEWERRNRAGYLTSCNSNSINRPRASYCALPPRPSRTNHTNVKRYYLRLLFCINYGLNYSIFLSVNLSFENGSHFIWHNKLMVALRDEVIYEVI